jgi:hypothetical protein
MIALPGGRGWPAAASWNRASHIAEGDGTARRRGLRQRACSARQQSAFDLAHHLDKAGVLLQPLQILQTVAARQVQHDQRHDHLKIEPALLPGDPDMLLDRDIQPLIRSR